MYWPIQNNNPEYEVLNGQFNYYGYSDFKDIMIKNVTPTQRHNITISGGSEKPVSIHIYRLSDQEAVSTK